MRQLLARRWPLAALAAAFALMVVAGLLGRWLAGYAPAPPFQAGRRLASISENGVRVEVALERDARGTALIAATFTPLEASGHVYSKDLPRQGIQGAGRPTLVEIPQQPGLRAIGPQTEDRATTLLVFPGFSAPFPVYPDGPVTMRVPVEAQTGGAASISITYMACSSQGFCLPPVQSRRIALDL